MHIEAADQQTIITDASGNGFVAYVGGLIGRGIAQFPVQTSVISEACGILFALQRLNQTVKRLITQTRLKRIHFVSDCKPLVQLLKQLPSVLKRVENSVLRTILNKIVAELRAVTQLGLQVTFEWQSRHGNPAHHLIGRYRKCQPKQTETYTLEPTLYPLQTENSQVTPPSNKPEKNKQAKPQPPHSTRTPPRVKSIVLYSDIVSVPCNTN